MVLEEIAQYADQPSEQVLQQLLTRGCGSHPYGRPILGQRASLKAMTPAAMDGFHRRRYLGSNCCIAVAGQSMNRLGEMLAESQLADLPSGDIPAKAVQQVQVQSGRHLLSLDMRHLPLVRARGGQFEAIGSGVAGWLGVSAAWNVPDRGDAVGDIKEGFKKRLKDTPRRL